MRRTALIAFVVPLALLAGACSSGGDDLTDREQEFADAIAAGFTIDEGGFPIPDDEARCLGEAVMAELGAERFDEADLEPEDFETGAGPGELLGDGEVDDDEAESVIDDWQDCTDLPAALAGSFAGDDNLDDDTRECLADVLDDDTVDFLLVPAFTTASGAPDDEAAAEVILEDLSACIEPSDDGAAEGDGDASFDLEGVLVDGFSQGFAAEGLSETDARCVAEGVVEQIGVEAILEMDYDPSNPAAVPPALEQALAVALLAAADDCGVDLPTE